VKRVARFHRLARRELIEAAEYYDRESPGLGTAFLDVVETCVSEILEHPAAAAIVERPRSPARVDSHAGGAGPSLERRHRRRRRVPLRARAGG
jgi:hypothetical protein